MVEKPVLVILAAGIGSRYGGLKQIDPVGENGELIIDYSIYDALLSGFDKVVFVIRRDIEKDFCERIFNRISKKIKAEYVFQDLDDLPKGFTAPKDRVKPWGTTQAILAARDVIDTPFCVINADDFYGRNAYVKIKDFLKSLPANCKLNYSMIGYKLCNTLSEKGGVSRGVCKVDKDNNVIEINECHGIRKDSCELDPCTDVSMNIWGFTPDVFPLLQMQFESFLETYGQELKDEYPVPVALGELLKDGVIKIKMISTDSNWFGFTYPEDKETVKKEITRLVKNGIYPTPLQKLS